MKVLVALSGGPRSLVTAWLLKKQGMQVRAVHYDLFSSETNREKMREIEKRLGITVQIIDSSRAFGALLLQERFRCIKNGLPFRAKETFHIEYLASQLCRLQDELGFDRMAMGNMVTLQEDPAAGLVRVMTGSDFHFDSVALLAGFEQSTLSKLMTPIGSIPESMLAKLTGEVAPVALTQSFEIDWRNLENTLDENDPEPLKQVISVFASNGAALGSVPYSNLKVGAPFVDSQEGSRHYLISDIQPTTGRAIAQDVIEASCREFHFKMKGWFSRSDLGLSMDSMAILNPKKKKPIPMKVIQYEGNRLKGVVDEPLVGPESNIFKGDLVLLVQGLEILGAARIIKVK